MHNRYGRPIDVQVSLRKESLDRNLIGSINRTINIVALRKESVDRNIPRGQLPTTKPPSLSARRAWIEIVSYSLPALMLTVALRKESVDRNQR